jgi:alpha-1,2-rhamnosyltransferase
LPEQVEPGVGDILLILDAAWNYVDDYPPVMQMIKARGGKSVVCIYDILPLTYPSLFQPRTVQNFQDWHERIVRKSDAAIAISHATAESLLDFTYKGHAAPASPFPVGWWPLGADFAKTAAEGVACKEVAQVAGGEPYFLSVGTLEPRKGYPTALDAFERLWRAGSGARYVIVGRPGWNTRALQKRLRNHPELGRRLFWFSNASDADLQLLYAQARGVMLASVAEGFGLPLVEAALHGVPVIASDIPVFREVGGDGARYFKLLDPASLATAIEETLAQPKAPPAIKTISWAESAKRLVKVVREEAYQLRG